MVLVNPKDPPQKCRGFFFKNNLLFIWLLKNCLYLCTIIITKSLKQNIMKTQKQTVKIFGQEVTVGTKLHAKLVQQKKQFDDLNNN